MAPGAVAAILVAYAAYAHRPDKTQKEPQWLHPISPVMDIALHGVSSAFSITVETGGRVDHQALRPKGGNLVFTSAGDHTNLLENWRDPKVDSQFDVFLVYYGNSTERYEQYQRAFRWTTRRRAAKIQNFYTLVWRENRQLLEQSDYVFMLDDDIMFDHGVSDINRMFAITREYNLTISMPSFDRQRSYISYDTTAHNPAPGLLLTYVSNIEFNAPLLTREALVKMMQLYDPSIIGWGCPHLFICANGPSRTRYAVVHAVVTVNPHTRKETGSRELQLIPGWEDRQKVWEDLAAQLHCPPWVAFKNYENVYVRTGV